MAPRSTASACSLLEATAPFQANSNSRHSSRETCWCSLKFESTQHKQCNEVSPFTFWRFGLPPNSDINILQNSTQHGFHLTQTEATKPKLTNNKCELMVINRSTKVSYQDSWNDSITMMSTSNHWPHAATLIYAFAFNSSVCYFLNC